MFNSIFNSLFGCSHQRTTFPITPGRKNAAFSASPAARTNTYVVCLDCGKEFAYDWQSMRIGEPVTSAPVATVPLATVPLATASVAATEAQPMYR